MATIENTGPKVNHQQMKGLTRQQKQFYVSRLYLFYWKVSCNNRFAFNYDRMFGNYRTPLIDLANQEYRNVEGPRCYQCVHFAFNLLITGTGIPNDATIALKVSPSCISCDIMCMAIRNVKEKALFTCSHFDYFK